MVYEFSARVSCKASGNNMVIGIETTSSMHTRIGNIFNIITVVDNLVSRHV